MRRFGWVFYDGDCAFCRSWLLRLEKPLRRRGFGLAALQEPWVGKQLGLPPEALLEELKVLSPEGHVLGGADAFLHLARNFWWAWPLWCLGALPGARPLLRRLYRFVAGNRHCLLPDHRPSSR